MSSAIFNCIGSSSTTSTFLGSINIWLSCLSSSAGSSVSGKGNSSLNTLPLPSSLSTSIVPSKTFTKPFVRNNPRPNPSELIFCAARSNGAKILFSVSSSIPIPVSLISIFSFPSEYLEWKLTVPDGVNFMAFVSKLARTCSNLSASPFTVKLQFSCTAYKIKALEIALRENSSEIRLRKRFRSNGISLRKSPTSLIR